MAASLSRYLLQSVEWIGRRALHVEITTSYTDRYIQLYAGRKLAGVSAYPGQNRVVAQVEPTHCPTPITLVMVEIADRFTDFGAKLPRRPFNREILRWSQSSGAADLKWYAVYGSSAAGDPVDYTTVIARVPYIGDGAYQFELPAVDEYGEFTYGLTAIDDALPAGNEGTPAELAATLSPYPPDVLSDDNDQRLTPSIAAGVLTVAFAYEWEPA